MNFFVLELYFKLLKYLQNKMNVNLYIFCVFIIKIFAYSKIMYFSLFSSSSSALSLSSPSPSLSLSSHSSSITSLELPMLQSTSSDFIDDLNDEIIRVFTSPYLGLLDENDILPNEHFYYLPATQHNHY